MTMQSAFNATAITAFTSATVASFITAGWPADRGAGRWKTFLSNISLTAAASGFDVIGHASIVTKSWHARVRG